MTDYRNYWEHNIDRWGEFYLEISHGHEQYDTAAWWGALYNATIAKLEARLMRERFELTLQFIREHVTPGSLFADIGCGTGIFVVEALKCGARVRAIDFSRRALEITQLNVKKYAPDGEVSYYQLDVQSDELPKSDVAIMIGVTPYLGNLEKSLENVLDLTDLLLSQFSQPTHWANRLRRALPILNVRRLIFHPSQEVDAAYARKHWKLLKRTKFATGFVDLSTSSNGPKRRK